MNEVKRITRSVLSPLSVFLVGGRQSARGVSIFEPYSPTNKFKISSGTQLKHEEGHCCCWHEGKLYVIQGQPSNQCESYDLLENRWATEHDIPNQKYLGYACAASLGEKLYVFGGYDPSTGERFSRTYAFSTRVSPQDPVSPHSVAYAASSSATFKPPAQQKSGWEELPGR